MEEQKTPRFGDRFNLNELFRVKNEKGLFCKFSEPHKSGMIMVINLVTSVKKLVPVKNLVCLAGITYQTEMGVDNATVSDVLSNLYTFYDKKDKTLTPSLNDFLPNYDKNDFKEYKSVQLLDWFTELITKIKEINETTDKKED
jgi:hypothetical protein